MKTPWNRTGKIKAALLVVFALPSLFIPFGPITELSLPHLIAPFVLAIIVIPVNCLLFSSGREIVMPHWNDNPMLHKRPLAQYQFYGLFFLSVGFSIAIGSKIHLGQISDVAPVSILLGLGIIAGIRVTLVLRSRL